jgi:aminoglycoside phosphotransferase (APT) family kinase protein
MSTRAPIEERSEAALWDWLGSTVGGEIENARLLVSGNSRTTWAVDVVTSSAAIELVVRTDTGDGPFSGTALTLAREAVVYRALQSSGIRIPRFYGYDDGLGALAIGRAPGDEAWDGEVLDAVLTELARLHALDVDGLQLPGYGTSAREELELWAQIARRRVRPESPVLELAFELLRAHFPGEPARAVLVHGDAGPGNVLWDAGGLSALLDWEFAHIGDPHDDVAFLTVRAGLFGRPLPDFAQRVASSYAALAGIEIDETRLRYWQAVGVMRNLVTCLCSVSNPIRGRDRLVHHMLIPSLDRLLLGQLAELEGVTLEPAGDLPPAPELPGAEVMDELAGELSGLVDAIADPERRQRARRARYLFAQLAQTWPLAFAIAEADAAEPAGGDTAGRLRRLTRIADRRLALFPRARELAMMRPAGLT